MVRTEHRRAHACHNKRRKVGQCRPSEGRFQDRSCQLRTPHRGWQVRWKGIGTTSCLFSFFLAFSARREIPVETWSNHMAVQCGSHDARAFADSGADLVQHVKFFLHFEPTERVMSAPDITWKISWTVRFCATFHNNSRSFSLTQANTCTTAGLPQRSGILSSSTPSISLSRLFSRVFCLSLQSMPSGCP